MMEHISKAIDRAALKQKLTIIKPDDAQTDQHPAIQIVEKECSVCNDAGWTRRDEFGPDTGYRSVLVPCPSCTPGRRSKQSEVLQARLVDRLFGGSQIPYRARTWEFSTFPSDGDQSARDLVEHFVQMHKDMLDETSKRGLWLAGGLGRGKTGLSICALKEFMRSGHLSLFVSTPELMDRLRATFGKSSDETQDELLKVITHVPFLVLDDLGVEKPTVYVLERFYLIIDKRQSRGLYTIFSSNLSTKDLESYWRPADVPDGSFHPGLRIVERIREYCIGVSIKGRNLREIGW
jgi:DNA replication protein DnaC